MRPLHKKTTVRSIGTIPFLSPGTTEIKKMNISELRSFLDSLTGFFEKKHPSDKTVELWFDTANGIPSAEIRQIYQRITRECESWPRNLPATMWAIHYDIIANLHTAEKTYKYCDAGCNEGLFHMRKKNELGFYGQHCVFRCDTCKQRTEGASRGVTNTCSSGRDMNPCQLWRERKILKVSEN